MQSGSWRTPAQTLAIAAAGAALSWSLSLPAPFLTGPAVAVTLAGLLGVKAAIPMRLRNVVFVIIGLTIGQGVTPEVLNAMRSWPLTLASLAASLFAIIFVTRAALMRVWSMDKATAFLSSTPGHLSYVLGLTEGIKADLKTVAIVQSIRVLALTLLVPVAVTLAGQIPQRAAVMPEPTAPLPLLVMFAIAGLAGFLLNRLKLPAAYLIGGMVISTLLHVTGTVKGVMPFALATAAFISMGALIGSRFSGVTWPDLRRALGAGALVTLVAVALAGLFAVIAHELTGMDLTAILIAFAPGGLETMAAMSVILGIDPTFVATHHIARLLMLTVIVPFFVLRRGRA